MFPDVSWVAKLLSAEDPSSRVLFFVFLSIICILTAPSVFALFSPSKAGQCLASSLSTRHTAGWCPWRPTQPRLSTCASSSLLTGAPAGAGCLEPAANSSVHLCTGPAGHLIHRGARHVVLGRLLGGVPPRSAETSAVQARWPWTFRPSALLPAKLGAWRDESARAACQGAGPGLGTEGSWWQLRPCDCRRLRVSQGPAGPPAHRWAQSEMASHDLAVGVCVPGVGEETGGRGSDFRIQAGNSKYICASRADMHHMTSLILLMQKLGFGRGHTHKPYLAPAVCRL